MKEGEGGVMERAGGVEEEGGGKEGAGSSVEVGMVFKFVFGFADLKRNNHGEKKDPEVLLSQPW